MFRGGGGGVQGVRFDRTVRGSLVVCVGTDVWVGLAWLLSAPARLASPSYDPARHVLAPFVADPDDRVAYFGCTLILLAALVLGLLSAPRAASCVATALVGFWLFWAVAFVTAALASDRAGWAIPALIVTQAWSHVMLARRLAAAAPS